MQEFTQIQIDAIREHLTRLEDGPVFSHAERLVRFLRYIVDEVLAGRGSGLNQYALGIDVFNRDETFDPAVDSVVRVEAGRLRAKLREYYDSDGHGDAVRFELPKGTYQVKIHPQDLRSSPLGGVSSLNNQDAQNFRFPESRDMCVFLTRVLQQTTHLSEYMERVLPAVGRSFGTLQVILVDYREQTNDFVLLHYQGYSSDARHLLQRRIAEMQVHRGIDERHPYFSETTPGYLCLPLYFRDILEATIVLEFTAPVELSEQLLEIAEVISISIGLLMSSMRLRINQDQVVGLDDAQRARQIQASYLPSEHPTTEAFEVFGYSKSSPLVGGDYFDYFSHKQNSIQGILADACGHGVAAALIVTTFRGLPHAEMQSRQEFDGLFDALNESVHSGQDFIQYLTGIFFDYSQETRRLRYLNAGHYAPLVVDTSGSVRALSGGGPPLGMFHSSNYALEETQLCSGDLLALFTDGLADIRNKHRQFFGVEGITEVLKSNRERPLEEMTERIIDSALAFGAATGDDLTVFLMKVH